MAVVRTHRNDQQFLSYFATAQHLDKRLVYFQLLSVIYTNFTLDIFISKFKL